MEFQELEESINTMDREIQSYVTALRENGERFHRALENIPDVVSIYDCDLRIRYINAATFLGTGRLNSDFIGKTDEEIWPPEVYQVYLPTLQKALETRTAQYLETDLLIPNTGLRSLQFRYIPILDDKGGVLEILGVTHDFTERRRIELEQQATIQFLRLADECRSMRDLIKKAIGYFQQQSGCEAVGVRLQEGRDYPYYEARGFSAEFLEDGNSLCAYSEDGALIQDSLGNPVLECLCGDVIGSRFDPSKPFFSSGGSFWTNNMPQQIATLTELDRESRIRNRCTIEGYESIALIPLYVGETRLGLLQLSDRRRGMFTPESIAFWEKLASYFALALATTRAKEELGESQRLIKSVVSGTTDAIYIKDVDGRYLLFNAGAEKLTGIPAADILGKDDSLLLSPEGAKTVMELDRSIIDTGRQNTKEETVISLSGKKHTYLSTKGPMLDKDGHIIGIIGISRDISARKEMEEELRESRDQLEIRVLERTDQLHRTVEILKEQAELLDLAHDAILVRDLDGIIQYWNNGAERTYGWTKEEALGNTAHFLLNTQFPKALEEIKASALADGHWEGELRHATRSGTPIVVASRWAVQKGSDGKPTGFLEINRDITEHMKMAEERERTKAQLQTLNDELEQRVERRTRELQETQLKFLHAEKLSAIGKLSASIAHEFNNPLQGIMTILKGLKKRAILEEEDRDLLDAAICESERVKNLIRNLQDFNRPSSGKTVVMDVHKSIDSLLLLCKSDFKNKRLSTELDYTEGLPQILAIPDQIKQVFLNLLTNAADACLQPGGVITISTWQEDTKVAIAFNDTGIGIQSEKIDLIFQPFYTTKPAVKGTGLGLSVCHGIVQNHRGKIRVESRPGAGSTFTVLLPIRGE